MFSPGITYKRGGIRCVTPLTPQRKLAVGKQRSSRASSFLSTGRNPAIPRSLFGLNEAQRQLAITSFTCMIGSIFV
jgi:hypothetical protein